jgi:hypothetical protein
MAERLLEELGRQVAPLGWPTADRVDITPIVGMFEGPRDLSARHHHYLDTDVE